MLIERAMSFAIEKSWFEVLKEEIQKPYILKLKDFLKREKERGFIIFPPPALVFNAFRLTPFDSVRVVIMGQDPYHGVNQAHGLCFSVQKKVPIPPSLRNICEELRQDLNLPSATYYGCLENWARQGVLLLNATLTVRAGKSLSHYGQGWEIFTDAVIKKLCLKKDRLVFILWGRIAQKKCENILNHIEHSHVILTAAHPCPYSVKNFFGCRHFSKTNVCLKNWGQDPIDWSLEEVE